MKGFYLIAAGLFAAGIVVGGMPVAAQAKTMKECAAEWDKMKAAKQTGGMKYRDFSKQCMAGGAAPAPSTTAAPAPATPSTAAPAPAGSAAKPTAKTGRQAEYARERACGAEWKADKAANRIPAGQKWPQYWSECNTRKKAQGM